MPESFQNPDGTWTITVMKDGKPVKQVVRIDSALDQMGWHDSVDDIFDLTHSEHSTNEANNELS